jgi:hypothetical protein
VDNHHLVRPGRRHLGVVAPEAGGSRRGKGFALDWNKLNAAIFRAKSGVTARSCPSKLRFVQSESDGRVGTHPSVKPGAGGEATKRILMELSNQEFEARPVFDARVFQSRSAWPQLSKLKVLL